MLPDGKLYEIEAVAEFVPGDDSPALGPVSRERGPQVPRATEAVDLLARMWVAELQAGNVILYPEDAPGSVETLVAAPAGATTVSLAFSQSGWPHIACDSNAGAWLWWYDTLAEEYTTLTVTHGSSPILTMDDKRLTASLENRNDILLFYVAPGGLAMRRQRDRFGDEIIVADASGRIVRAGLTVGWRVQVEME